MFSLLLHLWKYGIAKFLLFLPSVVEHPFWSLGMSFSFLSSGLFPRLSFPSVFFILFFLSPFAFRLFSPYLCSAGGGARLPSPFPFPSLSAPVGASRRFGSALAGLLSGPSGFPGAALFRLRRAPFAVPSRFLPPFRPAWPLAPCNPFSHFPMFRAVCALRAPLRPPSRVGPIWQGAPFPSRPPFCLFLRKLSPSGPKKSPVFLAVRLFCATFASAFALKRAVCPRGRRSLKGFT